MKALIELLPMYCTRCQAPVPAKVDELVWVCQQCGQGLILSDEKGVAPLDIHYANTIKPGGMGAPFWVTSGRVNLRRQVFNGDNRSLQDMAAFWQTPRVFFIPAYALQLEVLIQTAEKFLKQPPQLVAGSPAKFYPVSLLPDDIFQLVEFVIFAVESERRDMLKALDIQLQLGPAELWIL
jgi:hypothetical protein